MRPDNSRYLIQSARARSDAALTRARDALRDLDRAGQPVTFRGLAAAAGVSRAWLYRQPAIRAEIEQLRAAAPATARPVPAAQRGTDQSRQQRIEALLADNARLRADNTRLCNHVAVLLGERRDAQIRR
ncbi:MAG: DUF6262 family protein [Streptosporangiaceae bacterium]